ncbi:MAG: hypothetical protein NT067_00315, partial [Candidatus Diapherotrites archaeon]|nr:hypothetical protein [Candidatus Diapherotrites archaeon]
YAFAIEMGGIACIGINDLEPEMFFGIKERAYHEKRMSAEKDIHWMQKQVERKKAEIIRILEKNGFEAKFFSVPELRKRNLPREILVIRNPVRQKK